MPILGAHCSCAGGFARAFQRAREAGADSLQIFTRAPSRWEARPLEEAQVTGFRRAREEAGQPPVLAHDLYLTNLAAPDEEIRRRSLDSLAEEVLRCHRLGLDGLVCHLGAHMGAGEATGLARFAEGLSEVLRRTRATGLPILLETTAGQGTCLGHRFEHLAEVLCACRQDPRLGVCLDTCHVFAAGYDLATGAGYRNTWRLFDAAVGRTRLRALHLNDSQRERGSRVDRHANIGHGTIGDAGFRRLLRDESLAAVPMIVETPESEVMHRADLERLRRLAGKGPKP
ncbi:MAG: deoxyribonuclease IV [Candidatus Eremiobacterota bacterium]